MRATRLDLGSSAPSSIDDAKFARRQNCTLHSDNEPINKISPSFPTSDFHIIPIGS